MSQTNADRLSWVRPLAWGASATLILLPLFGMKLADARAWEPENLPFAFVMIGAVGLAFEFALRVPPGWTYSAGAVVAAGAGLLLTWGNLAVGFAGSEDNALNIIFFAVPAVALAGSLAVRFKAARLSTVMAGAAAAQFMAGLISLYYGHFTGPLTVTFTGLWLASSLLFLRSSRIGTVVRFAG
jgi:hypothetical protein